MFPLSALIGNISTFFLESAHGAVLFTAKEAGTYSVYGRIRFSEDTGQTFAVIQRHDTDVRTVRERDVKQTEFFIEKLMMLKNTTLSLDFSPGKAIASSCFFHVYKMQ